MKYYLMKSGKFDSYWNAAGKTWGAKYMGTAFNERFEVDIAVESLKIDYEIHVIEEILGEYENTVVVSAVKKSRY